MTPTREELEQLASKLQMVWESPDVEMRVKKRIVRTLIKEIVVDVDSAAGEVIVVIHWHGGCTPKFDCHGDVGVKTAVRYLRRLSTQ